MPRRRRIHIPGIASHAIVRGNDRQDIFRCDGDRLFFIRCLCEASLANALAVHAYVLMSNHVHILATSDRPNGLGRSIQDTGRRYVRYFNRRYERTGTLWEGRFRSTAVDSERYYFACHRYVEMNPVRASLVRDAVDYPWSSHRHYALGRSDDLVTPHPLMASLAGTDGNASKSFRALFEVPLPESEVKKIREFSNQGWVLGDEAFCRQVEAHAGIWTTPVGRGKARAKPCKADLLGSNGVV